MQNRIPRVSVILPVHNGEATIAEAVSSVLAQTFADLELIVIDDGSTDSTLQVLSGFTDARVRVFSRKQSGPAASRNRGIEHASGDIVAFIDADDVWFPDKLEAQLTALERVPNAAVAYCWTDYMDAAGNFVCTDSRLTFEGWVHDELLVHNFIDSGSNIIVRRQSLLEVGCFDESLPAVEDWDLYLKLSSRHPFVCVPKVLVKYRQSATSLTTRILLMEESYWRVIDRAFADAPASLQHLKKRGVALFYEYLTGKAAQGCPPRSNGLSALRFFAAAVHHRPATLFTVWRRPWMIKALVKAALCIVLPAPAMQKLVTSWRYWQGRGQITAGGKPAAETSTGKAV